MSYTNLPEKWAVERSESNYKCINAYFSNLNDRKYTATGRWTEKDSDGKLIFHHSDFLIFPKCNQKSSLKEIPEGYQLIDFETFRVQVLKRKPDKNKYYEIY